MSTATRARRVYSFRLLADMGRRFRIRSCVLAILLALMLSLQPAAPARAECDITGAWDATIQAIEAAVACQSVCEDKYRCYGAAALAIVLTEVSRRKGQDKVESFCGAVYDTLDEVMGNLKLVGNLTQDQISELSTALKYVGDVMAIVNCACETERLEIKNETSFGDCANQVLGYIGCGELDFSTATIGGCDPVGNLIGGWVNEGLDALVDLGCGWLWDCADHTPEPNYVICDKGYQSDSSGNCYPCENIAHAITRPNGECGCESLYSANSFSLYIGQYTSTYSILRQCTCNPPFVVDNDGHCLCPKGQEERGGLCVACTSNQPYVPYHVDAKGNAILPFCGQCPLAYQQSKDDPTQCVSLYNCDPKAGEVPDPNKVGNCQKCSANQRVATGMPIYNYYCEDCGKGQKVSADLQKCVPQCPPGSITNTTMGIVDPAAGKAPPACIKCAADEYASYDKPGSSVGQCLRCDPGTTSLAGSTACVPLNCGPSGYQDPDNANACKSCPPTQIWIPTHSTGDGAATPSGATLGPQVGQSGGVSSRRAPCHLPAKPGPVPQLRHHWRLGSQAAR